MEAASRREQMLSQQLAAVLHAHQLPLEPLDVARALIEAASNRVRNPLTEAEANFLADHGGVPMPTVHIELPLPSQPTLLTAAEVALRLGVDKSTVSRRAVAGKLVRVGNGRKTFPTWQFHHDEMVPGLDVALAAIPAEWGPYRLELFMTTSDETLDDQSPIDWLLARNDPGLVHQLLLQESRE